MVEITRMIFCDTSHHLGVGSCSSTFNGTLSQKVVTVERIRKDYTDETLLLPSLLTLNHANIAKVLHIEDDAEFRYQVCHMFVYAENQLLFCSIC